MRPAQYYKSNPRALSFREVARSSGLVRLPFAYIASRFMQPSGQTWLPYLWAELQCEEQDLTKRFFKATDAHRTELERLGFAQVLPHKSRRLLNPEILDQGGIWYLSGCRRHFCTLSYYVRLQGPLPCTSEREFVGVAFTAVLSQEILSCTNERYHFDPAPGHRVFLCPTRDVRVLHRHFLERVSKGAQLPREFSDTPTLQTWFDSNAVEVFEHHLSRGLYMPVSDAEVELARRASLPPLPEGLQ